MALIYDSSHSGQEIDAAVDAVQTTIPSQLTQIGSELDDLEVQLLGGIANNQGTISASNNHQYINKNDGKVYYWPSDENSTCDYFPIPEGAVSAEIAVTFTGVNKEVALSETDWSNMTSGTGATLAAYDIDAATKLLILDLSSYPTAKYIIVYRASSYSIPSVQFGVNVTGEIADIKNDISTVNASIEELKDDITPIIGTKNESVAEITATNDHQFLNKTTGTLNYWEAGGWNCYYYAIPSGAISVRAENIALNSTSHECVLSQYDYSQSTSSGNAVLYHSDANNDGTFEIDLSEYPNAQYFVASLKGTDPVPTVYFTIKNEGEIDRLANEVESLSDEVEAISYKKGKYGAVGDSITYGASASSTTDTPQPIYGDAKKTFAWHIAKRYNLDWYNYGVSGSTLGDVVVAGSSKNGFSKQNGRYTQLASGLTHLTIWFGWNDNAYGYIMKKEEWLTAAYGYSIYYPTSASLIGTTHSDGTPYATQEQYDACNSASGTVGGISYSGDNYFKALYVGTVNDNTNKTFYGAFNIVLDYIINQYPYIKILLIVPYGYNIGLIREAVINTAVRWGLPYYDIYGGNQSLFFDCNEGGTAPINGNTIKGFRRTTLLADGTHPNDNGYEYLYPAIGARLMSI